MNKIVYPGLLFLLMALILWGCKDPWDDHLKPTEDIPGSNLFQLLESMPELTTFTGYLVEAGWQEELESSKSFTVWAPDNEAMAAVEAGDLADSAALAIFVSNHIGFTAYSYYSPVKRLSVKTYSGKNIVVDNENGKVGEANLIEPYDRLASNGILHVIDKALIPKPNVWDIIESAGSPAKHVEYLNSLSGIVFDPSVATIIGVDPNTGQPVYDTLSGMVWSNRIITEVRDLTNEDSLSTVILVEDPVWDSEFSKYRPYYKLADSADSDELTRWMISRDLIFRGLTPLEEMPDTLISLYGIKIPFDPSAITQTHESSNGIIYVMSNCDVRLGDKIHPVIVEAEDTNRITVISVDGYTGYTRQVDLASGGYDFILDNHGASPGAILYPMGNFVAGFYEFYWVAVNDFNYSYRYPDPDAEIQQRLDIVTAFLQVGDEILKWDYKQISEDFITVVDSTYETAREVYLGQRLFSNSQEVWLQVTGSSRNSTICLDYIKAVPVLEE